MLNLKKRNKMITELNNANVVIGKYMYSHILDIISTSDTANEYELASEAVERSGGNYFKNIVNEFEYSEALSIQDGEYLIPLTTTYMVEANQKYRSDLKENGSVLGFAKKINYDELDKSDIAYFYELYQNYKNHMEVEQSKTYQLKR